MIREWVEGVAAQQTLTRIAIALERIAAVLEDPRSASGGTGLRSSYTGSGPDDASLIYQTEEDLAGLEALEKKYPDVSMDDDLEELGNGQEG